MAKSKSDISLNDLKAMLPQEGESAEQEATLRALSSLSPEDRDLLAAVQESPFRLTTAKQFLEFEKNVEKVRFSQFFCEKKSEKEIAPVF